MSFEESVRVRAIAIVVFDGLAPGRGDKGGKVQSRS